MKTEHILELLSAPLDTVDALSVGQQSIKPFGGKLRGETKGAPLSVGATTPTQPTSPERMRGCANEIMDLLARIGGTPCRMWGASVPGGLEDSDGCPNYKKLCGAVFPYNVSVAGSATGQAYTIKAKKWFWPLFWLDASASTVSVVGLTFQQDPVFENGEGSGALVVSALFGATGNYGFVPGLPAIDNVSGLAFSLANSAVGAAQFQGAFVGLSIRN